MDHLKNRLRESWLMTCNGEKIKIADVEGGFNLVRPDKSNWIGPLLGR